MRGTTKPASLACTAQACGGDPTHWEGVAGPSPAWAVYMARPASHTLCSGAGPAVSQLGCALESGRWLGVEPLRNSPGPVSEPSRFDRPPHRVGHHGRLLGPRH